MTKTPQPYDRAARRLADNRHGNQHTTGDYPAEVHDDVVRAVYPDPKAAALKLEHGETEIIDAKRALTPADDKPAKPEPKPATKPTTAGK